MMLKAKMLSIDFVSWDWKVEKKLLFREGIFFRDANSTSSVAFSNRDKRRISESFLPDSTSIKIDDFDSVSLINRCETCFSIKTHEMMFRRIEQKKSIDYSLNRVDYDLISINEKHNENFKLIISSIFILKWIFFIFILEKITLFRWFANFWKRFESNTIKSFDLYKWTTNVLWDLNIEIL
jgi:hypothetical protein